MRWVFILLMLLALVVLSGCVKYVVPGCPECNVTTLTCNGTLVFKEEFRFMCTCNVPVCVPYEEVPLTPDDVCVKDTDCRVSGCAGEICSTQPSIGDCVFKPEYACFRQTSCSCVKGICQWDYTNDAYRSCVSNVVNTQI